MTTPPRATVVVPTHDRAALIDLAVASALGQTVRELEVIIVGDGVGDDTRAVLRGLMAADERVRFLDLEKVAGCGEVHRDVAVQEAASDVICYLCDDELLLPDHVASMLELLATADLVQTLNGHLNADGTFTPYASGPTGPSSVEVALEWEHDAVSITGTAHRVSTYRQLAGGWLTVEPCDHGRSLWEQFFAEPGFRGRTNGRVTALRFPSHLDGRDSWDPEDRRAELVAWRRAMMGEGWRARFDAHVAEELQARRALGPDDAVAHEEPRVSWRSAVPVSETPDGTGSAVASAGGRLRARVRRLAFARARQHRAADDIAPEE